MTSKKLSDHTLALKRARRKVTASKCCIGDMLLELMNERKVEAGDIHRATGIPYSTLSDLINYRTKSPLLDGNILALSKFFNCSINYLAFGIGEGPIQAEANETWNNL
jgi:hypothetical protein